MQHCCKSNQLISLKLGVMSGPTNLKNLCQLLVVIWSDNSTNALTTAEQRILGNVRAFLRHWPIFTTLGEMTDVDKVMNPQDFGSDPAYTRIQIKIQKPEF